MTARLVILALVLAVAGIYLFVTAPPQLADGAAPDEELPVQVVLEILNHENATARALYTREIVGAGTKAGLSFSEKWRTARDGSGPLPALFLREIAVRLASLQTGVGLYLGSDRPVNAANGFRGEAAAMFGEVRRTRRPVFSRAPDTGLYTAMFPDLAVAEACINCHNEHVNSPKQDWHLGDVMGAVTWTFRKNTLSPAESAALIDAFRLAVGEAYDLYLEKAAARPTLVIGTGWPRDGYLLPKRDVFTAALSVRTSSTTLGRLLGALGGRR